MKTKPQKICGLTSKIDIQNTVPSHWEDKNNNNVF